MPIFPLGHKLAAFSGHDLLPNPLLKFSQFLLHFLILLDLQLEDLLGKVLLHHLILEDGPLGHLIESFDVFVQVTCLLLNHVQL